MPRGDAVIVWVTGDAGEGVLGSFLVVVFEEKPNRKPKDVTSNAGNQNGVIVSRRQAHPDRND